MYRIISYLLFCGCVLLPLGCDAAQKQAASTTLSAQNVVELRKHVGRAVTVQGFVERTGKSRSGNQFLNFQSSELSLICFGSDVKNFKAGGPVKLFAKKQIQVVGKLERYKNKLQIKLARPDQIRVIGSKGSGGSSVPRKKSGTADFKLKKIGDESWLSPAGVKYVGRDPQGLSRLEHVLRHASDIPNRAGPHGVFDGDDNGALATIDDAWKKIQREKIKPKNEGARSSFTVPMGRRVGFLGGQTGKRKRHPALRRVFIVVRTGTSEVVTAFPK